jgi:hypothetical protein
VSVREIEETCCIRLVASMKIGSQIHGTNLCYICDGINTLYTETVHKVSLFVRLQHCQSSRTVQRRPADESAVESRAGAISPGRLSRVPELWVLRVCILVIEAPMGTYPSSSVDSYPDAHTSDNQNSSADRVFKVRTPGRLPP